MKKFLMLFALLALAGCKTDPGIVTQTRTVEVKVPVTTPCIADRPAEVVALRDQLARKDWDELTTNKRQGLVGDQALARKIYGDQLTAASAGCLAE